MNMSASMNKKRNFAQITPPIKRDIIREKIEAGLLDVRRVHFSPLPPTIIPTPVIEVDDEEPVVEQPPAPKRFKALRMRASNDQSTL